MKRALIVGAGAVGQVYGAALERAGVEGRSTSDRSTARRYNAGSAWCACGSVESASRTSSRHRG
jgi:threonine dehydrogenase-like Zn-dependent dehydrogenase